MDREAVVGDNVFAGAWVIDVGCEAMDGGKRALQSH